MFASLSSFQLISIILSILAVVSAAVVVPAIKRRFFDPSMFLAVEVRPCPTKTKALAVKTLKEWLSTRPYDGERQKLDAFGNEGGYTSVTLRNVSQKKLANVTVKAKIALWAYAQVGDEAELQVIDDKATIAVGDITPGHDRVVHIWTMSDLSRQSSKTLKTMFQMSADELHSVRVKLPKPEYLQIRTDVTYWLSLLIFFGGLVIFLGALAALFTQKP